MKPSPEPRASGQRLKAVIRDLLPPLLLRALRPSPPPAPPTVPADPIADFYRTLLPSGGLCFDIGANTGSRLAAFRRVGCRVVALEPQSRCFGALQAAYRDDPAVTLVRSAVGRVAGSATMRISSADVLSTLSPGFIQATSDSGRFRGISWDGTEVVQVTTLDALIAAHGRPDYIKIDVEGYELEVVSGLSQPVPLVSLEWVPELADVMLGCIDHLSRLGPVEFNLTWGESQRLARRQWLDRPGITALIETMRDETYLFADIFIRSRPTP